MVVGKCVECFTDEKMPPQLTLLLRRVCRVQLGCGDVRGSIYRYMVRFLLLLRYLLGAYDIAGIFVKKTWRTSIGECKKSLSIYRSVSLRRKRPLKRTILRHD